MRKAPISLQDLRRSLYVKAKAEPPWRFWGLYVHVCKMETLREAYQMARARGTNSCGSVKTTCTYGVGSSSRERASIQQSRALL
jgi:hypothetical protein